MRLARGQWGGRLPWLVWTAAILALTVPWGDLHTHAHWQNLATSVPLTLHSAVDVAGNVLLYVPFGYWRARGAARVGPITAQAALLSVFVEMTQVMSHSRIPSIADVASNALGAAVGVWVRGRVVRSR